LYQFWTSFQCDEQTYSIHSQVTTLAGCILNSYFVMQSVR